MGNSRRGTAEAQFCADPFSGLRADQGDERFGAAAARAREDRIRSRRPPDDRRACGLPAPKLEGATTAQARQRCGKAIVGTGHIEAAVTLAGLARIDLRVPLTLFNGPRRDGNPTVLAHARAPFPISETYVIVAPIERIHGSIYGYRSEFDIPPIAGGFGSLTRIDAKIGRRYRFQGRERSYVSARCSDYILQTRGFFSFADGTVIYGSAFKGCTPRP